MRSRGRPAKLLASMSSPVSTKLPLVGHTNFSIAIATFTQSNCNQAACVLAKRCETTPHHAALRLSRSALKFALPLSHPCSHCGFSRRFHSWPSTDGFMALIADFRLESSSPEQKFVSQRPADADCLNLGSHKPRLTPAHDEKIARSTEQNAGRCDAESTKPHLSAPIGYEYESSSLSTLFSSCRARRRNDRRLR